MSIRDIVGVSEAAREAGISVVAIRYNIATGKLHATRFGQNWAIDRTELAEFKAKRGGSGRIKPWAWRRIEQEVEA